MFTEDVCSRGGSDSRNQKLPKQPPLVAWAKTSWDVLMGGMLLDSENEWTPPQASPWMELPKAMNARSQTPKNRLKYIVSGRFSEAQKQR